MLEITDASLHFTKGGRTVRAVDGVSLEVEAGTLTVIVGRSGSGKSTLLSLAGGLRQPDSGTVAVAGIPLDSMDEDGLYALRRRSIGYVFQEYNLVEMLTALENVALPALVDAPSSSEAVDRARQALTRMGLEGMEDRYPQELSGGERQRVAIARAVAGTGQRLILADEPTGALDSETASGVMDCILDCVRAGSTALVVTHERWVARLGDEVVRMSDGQLLAADRLLP